MVLPFFLRISCQDVIFPKGFGMKNKSKPFIIFRLLSLEMLHRRVEIEKQQGRKS